MQEIGNVRLLDGSYARGTTSLVVYVHPAKLQGLTDYNTTLLVL